jgi:hypothetical protein
MIDYQKIAAAIGFYKQNDFEYVDVPWVVSEDTMLITAPRKTGIINSDFGCLVGSAEQSFLQMIKDKELPLGKYVACTPCFRQEQEDYFHKPYFMKVELIRTDKVDEESLQEMINMCLSFFSVYTPCSIEKTDIGFDIISENRVELGSYGIRKHADTGPWLYGTGCAEPRLSTVHGLRKV